MPTYEYICAKCGHEFEKIQPMADKTLTICPQDLCVKKKWGRGAVKRKMSGGAGLIFKGSGFYITDYRSEGYKAAAKKDSESSKPSTDSAKSSTPESKPASPKTESKSTKPSTKKD